MTQLGGGGGDEGEGEGGRTPWGGGGGSREGKVKYEGAVHHLNLCHGSDYDI